MRNSPAIPLSLAVALMSALALADVRQQDGDIVMENEFIRVTLVPKVGGKAKSFFLKAANLEVTEWP
jgi:hypothetical protein